MKARIPARHKVSNKQYKACLLYTSMDGFYVSKISIKDKRIVGLAIRNTKTKERCFTWWQDDKEEASDD